MEIATKTSNNTTTCRSNRLIGVHCLCQCRPVEPTNDDFDRHRDVDDDDEILGHRLNKRNSTKLSHREPFNWRQPGEQHKFYTTTTTTTTNNNNNNNNGFTMLHSSSSASNKLRNQQQPDAVRHRAGLIAVGDLNEFSHSTNKSYLKQAKEKDLPVTQIGPIFSHKSRKTKKAVSLEQHRSSSNAILLLIAHLMALVFLLSQCGLLALCEPQPAAAQNTIISVVSNPASRIETTGLSSNGEFNTNNKVDEQRDQEADQADKKAMSLTLNVATSSSKDEASKVAGLEILQASESQSAPSEKSTEQQTAELKYEPPVNQADSPSSSSALAGPTRPVSPEPATPALQQATAEDVPVVSGIVGQEDSASGQHVVDSAVVGGGELVPPPSSLEQVQQENASSAAPQAPEADSARIQSAENDVLAVEQFGRKQIQQVADPQQTNQLQQSTFDGQIQSKTSKNRSIKRAFAGHLGIFGRKRSQAPDTEQQSTGSAISAEFKEDKPAIRSSREHHYYYQTSTRSATSTTTARPSVRGRLKSADYPDYREILVQPDQADQKLQQQQQQQQQQNEQLANHRQEPQENEQQRVEQSAMQVGENDFSTAELQLQQQQQQDVAANIEPVGTSVPELALNNNEQAQVGTESSSAAPYIRLSNIATINSTSTGNSSGQSGEMKLMRIYVIDLDQKLVVGNNQPGADLTGESLKSDGLRYDTSSSSSSSSSSPAQSSNSSALELYATTPQMLAGTSLLNYPSHSMAKTSDSNYQSSGLPGTTRSYLNSVVHEQQQQPVVQSVGVNEQLVYNQAPAHHQQQQQQQISSESYGSQLDRNSLQANLSRMFGQMSHQERSNYSRPLDRSPEGHRFLTLPVQQSDQQQQGQHQHQQQPSFMYTPLVVYDGGAANVTGQSSAQLSGAPKPTYSQLEQLPLEAGQPSPSLSSSYLYKNNASHYTEQQQQQQSGGQIAAAYSQPVQVNQRQVYQAVVPQYIAPQYSSQSGASSIQSNPDKEYENWPPMQQAAPDQALQLQVQYNNNKQPEMNTTNTNYYYTTDNQASNYTSKPTSSSSLESAPFQALARQQDKHHHANKSSVYHQESAVYQQTFGSGAGAGADLPAATYRPFQVPELAQVGQQQQQRHHYQQQQQQQQRQVMEVATTGSLVGAYKVTTAPTGDQRWKPVDHLAPAKILRQQADQGSALSQPAQYSSFADSPTGSRLTSLQPINGYNAPNNDHDVVSLAGVGKVHIPAGYQLLAAAQQAAASADYPQQQQQQVELPYQSSAGDASNHSDGLPLDGQHAPLNYRPTQPRKPAAQIYPLLKQSSANNNANLNTNAADQQQQQQYDSAAAVYADDNQHRYHKRPITVNDAPSQQVTTLHQQQQSHYHPSLSAQQQQQQQLQYNGSARPTSTNEFDTAGLSLSSSGQQQLSGGDSLDSQNQQHLNNKATGYAQINSNQQYGTGHKSAYGNPRQFQLAASGQSENLPADQSSFHSVALEAPRIPQAQPGGTGAGYRHSAASKQPASSAYMAVSGPAVADGVYETHDAAAAAEPLTAEPPIYAQGALRSQPTSGGNQRNKWRNKGKRKQGVRVPSKQSIRDSQDKLVKQQLEPNLEYYQQEQQQQQVDDLMATSYQGQRAAPVSNVASYYRPPSANSNQLGGTRALLSWETISSVASEAAKRLPSLSSILAPFAGAAQTGAKGQLYPTANQQQQQQQQQGIAHYPYQPLGYTKSAHYDRDVAAFHRPYPIRHMNGQQQQQLAGAYSDSPDSSTSGPSYSKLIGEQEESSEAGEYELHQGDLSSSSSSKDHSTSAGSESNSNSNSNNNNLAESLSMKGSSSDAPELSAPASEGELPAPERPSQAYSFAGDKSRPAASKPASSAGQQEPSSADDDEQAKAHAFTEVISDLAEIEFAADNPAPQAKAHRQRQKGPQQQQQQQQQQQARKVNKKRPAANHSEQTKLEDLEQAAVLSSIEQQLADADQPLKLPSKQPRPGRRPPKKAPTIDSLPLGASKGLGVLFPAGGLIEEGGGEALNLGRRPLMPMQMSAGDERLLPALPLNAHLQRPSGAAGSLNSVQIGQYRLTPQTQLVQSIFEPSRQMIGSYFRQYIGQLGQLGR